MRAVYVRPCVHCHAPLLSAADESIVDRDPVDDGRAPVEDRVADPAAQLDAGERGVVAAAGELGGDDLPRLVGVEHDEVGRSPGGDRSAVTVGDAGDRRRPPRQRRDDVGDASCRRR